MLYLYHDILAHVGWVTVLLGKSNPEFHFGWVLTDQPDSIYTLIFKNYWLLTGMIAALSLEECCRQTKLLFRKLGRMQRINHLLCSGICVH